MPRSWPERVAKRSKRLMQSLDILERKGRTDKPYETLIGELAELCDQIVPAVEEAKRELHQVKTDAIFWRRKMEEDTAAFKRDRQDFADWSESQRKRLKDGGEDLARQKGEIAKERAELADALSRAGEMETKCQRFLDTVETARGKL